jgi:hypothetical protein
MSYKRMAEQERRLEAEVKACLDQAQAADAAEDAQHGADHRGDETPAWMADKQRRLERIRAAKAQLEAEARAGALFARINRLPSRPQTPHCWASIQPSKNVSCVVRQKLPAPA